MTLSDADALFKKLIAGSDPSDQLENFQLLAVDAPPFLKNGLRLAKIRFQTHGKICATTWALVSRHPELDCHPLVSGKLLDAAIMSHGEEFELTRETAIPYLRFMSVMTDYPLVEQIGDIQWFTPLYSKEKEELEDRLSANPPQVTGSNDYSIDLEWCTVQEGKLLKIRAKLYTRTIHSLPPGKSPRAGQCRDIQVEVLLSGFSGNSRHVPGNYPGSMLRECIPDEDGWGQVLPEESRLVASDINRFIFPIINIGNTKVRRKWLEWYQIHLYQFEVSGPLHGSSYCLLWKEGSVTLLDGSSPPIHELNQSLGLRIDSEERATAYTEFFCRYIRGEDGRFDIVTRPDHPCFTEFEQIEFAEGETLETIRAAVGPLRFQRMPDSTSFECIGTHVFYANTLFFATFEVAADTLVTMTSDRPIMACKKADGRATSAVRPSWAELNPSNPTPAADIRQLIEGTEFADLVATPSPAGERQIEIKDKIVRGAVLLEGQKLTKRLVLKNCYFRGETDFSYLTSESSFSIEDCVFDKGLKMQAARIGGALSFSRSKFLGGGALDLGNLSASSLSFEICAIEGALDARRSNVTQDIILDRIQVISHVLFDGASVGMDFRMAQASGSYLGKFRNSIGGVLALDRLRADSVAISDLEIEGSVSLFLAVVGQCIIIGDTTVSENGEATVSIGRPDHPTPASGHPTMLHLYGASVERNYVAFNQIDVHGSVDCTFLKTGTGLFLNGIDSSGSPIRIAGDLDIRAASLPEVLRIELTEIGGKLNARGIKAGHVTCVGSTLRTEEATTARPIKVGKEICFADAEIRNEAFFIGVETGGITPSNETQSLNFRRARIGGDLEFYGTPDLGRRFDKTWKPDVSIVGMRSRFPHGINLEKATVGGDLDLSGSDVSLGMIDLSDAEIARDVKICRAGDEPTRARSLSIEAIDCRGCMDLSGLSLSGDGTGDGDVNGRNAGVKLQLRTFDGDVFASIPGRLDLRNANVGELEVSERTFGTDRNHPESINLGRANVGKLTVDVCEGKYPRPIKLGQSQIQWWVFRHPGKPPSDRPQDYIKFLDGDQEIQRHTWRAVEESLYNRGMNDEADEIHKAMLKSLRRPGNSDLHWLNPKKWGGIWGAFRRAGAFLWDSLTDSVTSWGRPVAIILIWLVASTYLFSFRENVWSSDQKEGSPRESPSAQQWGGIPGFWLALRHHAPIAHFTAEEDWKPRNDRKMWLWKRADGSAMECPVLTPESYGNVVIALHLLLWPVIAVIASRKLLRRAKQ